MKNEKTEGRLTFDVNSGKFWITTEDHEPLTSLEFGDDFEVKVDGNWIETKLQITNDLYGNLVFKLANTPYSGVLDDLEVRK